MTEEDAIARRNRGPLGEEMFSEAFRQWMEAELLTRCKQDGVAKETAD
jgi:hypothetical protein